MSLRRASFADNEISSMEGLEGCVALEELCLQDNRIGLVAGIHMLTRYVAVWVCVYAYK